ncbi:MAG: DUF6954 family protein [Anaerovoracaceae bacterium]|jgi:hypothetical protein
MKRAIGILVALVLGSAIGFFGVFLSVFSDGAAKERIATIGVILLIYLVLGVVFGLIWPTLKWLQGLMLGLPGALLLLYYMLNDFNVLYVPYFLVILILPALASNLASKARSNTNKA